MSVKAYRLTDRIYVNIGELGFKLSPLSMGQKKEIRDCAKIVNGEVEEDYMLGSFKSIKYAVKGIKGLETLDGEEYAPEFDEDGSLSDNSVEDLLNLEVNGKLMIACMNLLNGIPNVIVNPATGERLEGVEIVKGK